MNFTIEEAWEVALLALCVWREARDQTIAAKAGVAWSIRNRVQHPTWWGTDYQSVILKPKQYSSFNPGDPNATKFPIGEKPEIWQACLMAAEKAYRAIGENPIDNATSYFDKSMDADPPAWAARMTHVCDIDALRFFRV